MGILSMALIFGTALFAGCDDGSSLAGTTWVAETTLYFLEPAVAEAKIKGKTTLDFTSAVAGTFTAEITEWIGNWSDANKTFINTIATADNGPFTSTYDSATKTGALTYNASDISGNGKTAANLSFTVDVTAKTLTTTQDDDGEIETTVFNLR
jgi:hypothetical protein